MEIGLWKKRNCEWVFFMNTVYVVFVLLKPVLHVVGLIRSHLRKSAISFSLYGLLQILDEEYVSYRGLD